MFKKLAVAAVAVWLTAGAFDAGASCIPGGPCYPPTDSWSCGMSAVLPCQDGYPCPIEIDPLKCTFEAMTFKVGGGEIMASYNRACNPAVSDCEVLTPWHRDIAYKNAITNIVIEDGVEVIGSHAFYDLQNVTTVTIGKNVRLIWDGAFESLPSLESVTSLNPVPPEIEGEVACEPCHPADWCPPCPLPSFDMPVRDGVCLYVPDGSVDAYKNHGFWKMAFPCIEPLSTNSVRDRAAVSSSFAARVTVRNRTLHVRGSSSESSVRVSLIDMRGKSVASFTARGAGSFSLGNIPAGRYFVEVREGVRRERGSVVVGVK